MISDELRRFYERWIEKADKIPIGETDAYFDKFFTLYVVYNRLYAEATLELARNGIELDPNKFIPDAKAAKGYVIQFLGAESLVSAIVSDPACRDALEEMRHILATGEFAIHLRGPDARPAPNKDKALGSRLRSRIPGVLAEGVLEFIYAIRCNTFHGNKEIAPVQEQVLRPCITMLEKLNQLLYERLSFLEPTPIR